VYNFKRDNFANLMVFLKHTEAVVVNGSVAVMLTKWTKHKWTIKLEKNNGKKQQKRLTNEYTIW